jgi:hypothetical protein
VIRVLARKGLRDYLRFNAYSKARVPAMLHANVESRMIARKWYKLSVMNTAYFDPSRDYLYFQCRCRGQLCPGLENCSLWLLSSRLEKGMASKVIYELDEQALSGLFCMVPYHAPKVEEVLLVDSEKVLRDLAEAKTSDFTRLCQANPF